MKINITGRHFEITDYLEKMVEKKFKKLEKYFHKPIDIRIIMYLEKHTSIIEAVINGDGSRFHGTEKSDDMYSSLDLLIKSMEKQVAKYKEKHTGHKVVSPDKNPKMEPAPDEGVDVLFKTIGNKPIDGIEAYLEMKLDKRDFILFKKQHNSDVNDENTDDNYAVIYRYEKGFKMAEIPAETIKEEKITAENFVEFDLIVMDESSASPNIKFQKSCNSEIKCMPMNHAIKKFITTNDEFLPFFNNETNFFNIIYKSGDNLEIMVPSS